MPTYRYKPGFGKYVVRRGGKLAPLLAGETVHCPASELGAHIGRFELVLDDPKPPLAKLTIKGRGHGRYDVINPASGLAINDTPLSKEDAAALVEELSDIKPSKPVPAKPDAPTAPETVDPPEAHPDAELSDPPANKEEADRAPAAPETPET